MSTFLKLSLGDPFLRALLLVVLLAFGSNAMSYEEPGYAVVSQSGALEYRRYEPYLVAETFVEGAADFDSAGNEGFRRLFRYIAGGNTGQSKIAMTAPVSQAAQAEKSEKIAMTVPVQQAGSAAGWRIAFMLPRQYTLDTAPVPSDSRVRIVAVPGRTVAVLRYAGRWTESNYVEHRDELLKSLAAQGIRTSGEPWLARYNAPFSLPFLRRNEVLIEVDRTPGGAAPRD
jgi:hypothetical protein